MDTYETKLLTKKYVLWEKYQTKPKHVMKTQYTIHMQSRSVLEADFPRLFLLKPFSTLTHFNLKTYLIHVSLPPAYTALTFLVFFHIT